MDNTILVVEDDPELQEVLALNLQNAGYRVLRAGTTKQAEALMNATLPQLQLPKTTREPWPARSSRLPIQNACG